MNGIKSVLITGASSGIGKALAVAYAASGIDLYLTGRNEARLEEVQKKCQSLGAKVSIKSLDITDYQDFKGWVDDICRDSAIDLVIANAGVSAGTAGGVESVEQVKEVFATNIDGVVNTIHPVIEHMVERGSGQIAIIGSLAGFLPLPSAPAYCASKAAVRYYGKALRVFLSSYGVKVTVVTPGYVKTPLTDVNGYYMPFLMSSDKAAAIIKKRLPKNPPILYFPLRLYLIVKLVSMLPAWIVEPIFARLPGKPSNE